MNTHLIGYYYVYWFDISPDGFSVKSNITPPLGLASLTAYLRGRGLNITQEDLIINLIHDNNFEKNPDKKINIKEIFSDKKLHEAIKKYLLNEELAKEEEKRIDKLGNILLKKLNLKKPDLVGFSLYYARSEPIILTALMLAKKIKEKTEARIVFGGTNFHDSFGFNLVKNLDAVDFLVSSQGEVPLLKLCEALERGGDLKKVPSLIYKDGKRIKMNKPDIKFDFENAPPPDFNGLPLEKYRETHVSNNLVLPYHFIRGCPFRCSFCRFCLNCNFAFKPPEKVASEVEEITKKYGTRYLLFLNNTLNISNSYVEKICENLKGLDILWSDSVRPTGLSKGILTKMRKAGCIRLVHGIESASQRELDSIKKGFTVSEAERVVKNAHDADIFNVVNFLFGLPHQNEGDVKQIIKFVKNNKGFLDTICLFGFILTESDILYNPQNYRIKINEIKNKFLTSYTYDEIGGLKWNRRQSKKMEFLKMVTDFIKKEDLNVLSVDVHNLHRADMIFNLYDRFGSKKKVKENL